MKAGVITSVASHGLVLAWAVVSIAAPTPLEVADVEALPIDIVPFEELTKTIQGAKKADISKKPAPKPTKAPPRPQPAENVGETEVDKKAEAPVEAKAPPVEKTEAPAPAPKPKPAKEPTPAPKPKPVPVKAPTPVPTPELAPEPRPKTDIAMLLKQTETPLEEKTVEEAFQKLPNKVAAPKRRPTEQKSEPAQTNKRKVVDEVKTADSKASKSKKKSDATKKAVVNKADPNAGGAKRSKDKAALGAKKSNNNTKLAQSEIDALRGRLEGCWDVGDLTGHKDAAKMRARVNFNLTRDGEIDGRVKVKVSGTDRSTKAALAVRVRSAVTECAPYQLPAEKYDTWSEVVVNFSLQDML